MPGTNTYADTESADYLDAIRKHIAENRNANSAGSNFSPTFVLQRNNTINITTPQPTTTAKTLEDYDVVDNSSKLVAYLPMEYEITDAINNNHGTWTGNEAYANGPEIGNHGHRMAASFDGSSYITLDNESNFDFDINDAFSISCWYMAESDLSTSDVIVGKNDVTSVNTGWSLYRTSGSDVFVWTLKPSTSANAQVISTTPAVRDTWFHIVCTKSTSTNRTGMKIYINGIDETSTTSLSMTGVLTNNQSVVIGAESDGDVLHEGRIEDVQIWNVELDSDDVTDLYHGKQINKDTGATNPAILGLSDIA